MNTAPVPPMTDAEVKLLRWLNDELKQPVTERQEFDFYVARYERGGRMIQLMPEETRDGRPSLFVGD